MFVPFSLASSHKVLYNKLRVILGPIGEEKQEDGKLCNGEDS
jgi:hypothetical protein